MAEHNILTDPYIHEPKDISTASEGDIYIADGGGSGNWTTSGQCYCYGAMRFIEVDLEFATTGGGTWDLVTGANLTTPQSLWVEGQSSGLVSFESGSNNGRLVASADGDYWVTASLSITGQGTDTWGVTFAINGSVPANVAIMNVGTEINDTNSVTVSGILTLSAGDSVQLALKNITSTNDCDLQSGVVAIHLLTKAE